MHTSAELLAPLPLRAEQESEPHLGCGGCREGRYEITGETAEVHSNVRAFRHESFPLWRCGECGTINRLSKVALARYYAAYPFAKRKLDAWTRCVFANLLGRLRCAELPHDARILDFGCGEGIFVRYLRERGYAQADGYDPYSVGFANAAVLEQSYDALVAEDVIEHVEDPAATLAQWRSLLKPGGALLVGTPNADGLDLRDTESCVHSLHQPYHLHILSLRALLQLGAAAGLRPLRVWRRSYCDTLWPSVNFTFVVSYMRAGDNTLDACFEPPRVSQVLTSPRLLADALLGWFYPARSEMTVLFLRD